MTKAERTASSSITRRNLLKWGTLGLLVASPLGVAVWRKWKHSQHNYSYTLKDPIRRVENDYFPYVVDGAPSRWSGDTNGKIYTPEYIRLIPSGLSTDDPMVSFDVSFKVSENVPKNHLALANVSLYSDGKVFFITEGAIWNAPQKQPPRRTPQYYEGHVTGWTVRGPREYRLVTVPLDELEKIDKITVNIDVLVQG
jgi:hypothetical protein